MTHRTLVRALVVALALALPAGLSAQSDRSRAMGAVVDTSGGALPGVTVTLSGTGVPPRSVVTDDEGRYLTPWVAPGIYKLSFTLSGFETREVTRVVLGAGQVVVVDQQLALASLSETVEVKAALPPPPPPARVPAPPPKPLVKPAPELLASVCGPGGAAEPPQVLGKIVSRKDDPTRTLLGPRDVAHVDAGENQGLAVGQNLVIKRRFQTGDLSAPKKLRTFGEQSVGLAQIIEIDSTSSSAVIIYACGEILAGDMLEQFLPQPAAFTVSEGTPRFDQPAHIDFAEFDRNAVASGQMIVIDCGWMQGVQRGQRLKIFRRRVDGGQLPLIIGEGIVMSVGQNSATLRIDQTTDAVYKSDLVALSR
jgi:hypothetical protein